MAKHDYTDPSLTVRVAIQEYVEEDFTEVYAGIAALDASEVDHETRIGDNETAIADHEIRIDANEVIVADHETRIGVNETDIDDLETLTQETIGVNSNINELTGLTTALSIPQGGTGQVSAQEAIDALTEVGAASEEDILTVYLGEATFKPIADVALRTKTVRQTQLSGPDLQGTPDTVETSATDSGNLSSSNPAGGYNDALFVDGLKGSRGALVITKSKGVSTHSVQSSILSEARSRLQTSETAIEAPSADLMQQLLEGGVQLGSGSTLTSANMFIAMTNRDEIIDGNLWQWNDDSGFFMCSYVGTGVDRQLQHPMGEEILWFDTKNTVTPGTAHVTGRYGTRGYMLLNEVDAEYIPAPAIFPTSHTDTYISLGTAVGVNTVSEVYFMWGWAGEALDDLLLGMRGKRGVTAHWIYPKGTGAQVVETGITGDIQMIKYKSLGASDWKILNLASGFGNFTILNDTDAETTQTEVTVNGSEITFTGSADDIMFTVIGSTAVKDSNLRKAGTKVLRKVGTGAVGHRVDLGAAFSGGTNGGMWFGRKIESASTNRIGDTIQGADKYLSTDVPDAAGTATTIVEDFTDKGFILGSSGTVNAAELCQYSAFNTTHQTQTSDGLDHEHNPLTGYGQVGVVKVGAGAMTIKHPMGKKPRQIWAKRTDVSEDGIVYLDSLGATKYMKLFATDGTVAAITSATAWNNAEPTDTEITLGSLFVDGGTYSLYYWAGDDLDVDPNVPVTGELGVSAFFKYVGGSGAMSVDTGIENITAVISKDSAGIGNWNYTNLSADTYYVLNDTPAEAGGFLTVEGSVLSYAGSSNDVEFMVFGSKADSGIDNDVIIPSSPSDPTVVSMANGFGAQGNVDIVKELIASQTLNITGAEGQKFIYTDSDGLPGWSDVRPIYSRNLINDQALSDGYVYGIDEGKMYNPSDVVDPLTFIGECWVDNLGNVYDIRTYARGDVWVSDSFASLPSNIFLDDNPFGHLEILPQLVGVTAEGEEFVSTESLKADADSLTVTTDASPDAPEYKINLRRNF